MKQVFFIFITLFCAFQLAARYDNKIIVSHPTGDNHSGLPIYPADQPDVYYDEDEQEITIDGQWSEASYYDVDIASMSTLDTMLSTRVDSSDDTIDVSSLPDDNYKIVITSSNYNVYEGYFTNY